MPPPPSSHSEQAQHTATLLHALLQRPPSRHCLPTSPPLPLTNPPCSVEVCKYLSETRSGSRNGKVTLLPQKPCRGASLAYKHLSSWRAWQVPLSARMQQNAPSGGAPPSWLPSSTFSWTCNLRIAPSRSLSLSLSVPLLCSSTMFSLPPQPGKWGVKNLPRSPI